jgi:hypothetical protein
VRCHTRHGLFVCLSFFSSFFFSPSVSSSPPFPPSSAFSALLAFPYIDLILTHNLLQDYRQVSPFGTRRRTISLEDNAQPSIVHILGIKFTHGLWAVVFD